MLDPSTFTELSPDAAADKAQAFMCQLAKVVQVVGNGGYYGAGCAESDPVLREAADKV